MRYNETSSTLRRLPVYLVDSSGDPVTGAAPTGAEIKISKSGAAFVNGAGTWVEVADGVYYYQATQSETSTDSYLMLRIAAPGANVYVYTVDIGNRISINQPSASARRIPIYLEDDSGDGVPSLGLTGSEVQISVNGGAFANGTGFIGETGLGAYYYEAVAADVATEGYGILKIVDVAAEPYVYSFDVIGGGSTSTVLPLPAVTVESPHVPTSAQFVDHLGLALNRLTEQFKKKASVD